jgi:hypothetical protein
LAIKHLSASDHEQLALFESSSWQKLVRLSLEEPEILDARFTECWLDSAACKHLQDSGMMGGSVSHVGQLQYKMVVMDGNSLPDRFAHQMAMGNVILKQESPHEEFWYRDAIPWVHYIPVAHDLSNLVQRIKEGLANETLLLSIQEASTNLIREKVSDHNVECLWVQLLEMYTRYFDHPCILCRSFMAVSIPAPSAEMRSVEEKVPFANRRCAVWGGREGEAGDWG